MGILLKKTTPNRFMKCLLKQSINITGWFLMKVYPNNPVERTQKFREIISQYIKQK